MGGGLPIAAVVLLVGYGGSPVNAYAVNGRMILNNGFHRLYALMRRGVQTVPIVVQKVNDSDLEFPPVVSGLPKDYLLKSARPALLKDFFDEALLRPLKTRTRLKTVKIGWGVEQFEVPAIDAGRRN